MTDNEIIKALECCSKSTKEGDWNVCENECPYKSKCYDKDENVDFMQDVATLVNRQEAEIERLKTAFENSQTTAKYWHKTAKSKQAEIERLNALIICKNKIIEGLDKSIEYAYNRAIQEFAEKLKNKSMTKWDYHEAVDVEDIDNLVKEMVGE